VTGDPIRVITDEQSGVTLTLYRGDRPAGGMRTRYKLTKPGGTEFDLSITEWLGVVALADLWAEEA
jgi:hypothetical protein